MTDAEGGGLAGRRSKRLTDRATAGPLARHQAIETDDTAGTVWGTCIHRQAIRLPGHRRRERDDRRG
jgi:hypothetical protein